MSVTGSLVNDQDALTIACGAAVDTAVIQVTGTFVGTLLFEVSGDNSTWVSVLGAQGATIASSTTTTGNWRVSVSGYDFMRVRFHPVTSGTAVVLVALSGGAHNVAVTNATPLGQAAMANSAPVVLASDETVPVYGRSVEIAGQGPGVVNGINTDIIPATDVSAYRSLSFQITGTFSLTYTFQGSNDNVTWQSLAMMRPDSTSSDQVATNSTATTRVWVGNVTTRYLRIRATAWTSNASLSATLELFAHPMSLTMMQGQQVLDIPHTSGGTTDFHLVNTGTNNDKTNIKASLGQVYGYDIGNSDSIDAWLKFHNTAGTPTPGSGVVRSIYLPKGQRVSYHNGKGIAFSAGIGITLTGAATDADTTATTASKITVEIDYN